MRRVLLGSFVLAGLVACNAKQEAGPKEAPAPANKAKDSTDDGTGPAATVNGAAISRDVFNREFTQTMERYKKARHEVRPGLRERLKDNIVRRLVDVEVIRQQAKTMGVSVSEDERNTRWSDHRKRYGSDEAFKAFLERAGTTEDDIRRQFDNNLLREKLFSKVAETVSVTDGEVRTFYDENKNRYTEPEQVKARHILFRLPPNADDKTTKKVRAKARQVLKKVRRSPKKFAKLAETHSEDVTKSRGGELGWFAKGRMVKPFEEATWKLKDGQVSDIVQTAFGFHIIKKEGYKAARTKPFEEVEPLIRRSLTARRRNQAIQDSIKKWREDANIEVFVKGDPEIIKQDVVQPKPRTPSKPQMLKVQPAPPTDTRTEPVKKSAPATE